MTKIQCFQFIKYNYIKKQGLHLPSQLLALKTLPVTVWFMENLGLDHRNKTIYYVVHFFLYYKRIKKLLLCRCGVIMQSGKMLEYSTSL